MSKTRRRGIDTIFVLIIFSTFAFSVLMVLTLGAGIYKNINDITADAENERTALSYVRTKMRNLDNTGGFMHIIHIDDTCILFLSETIDGTAYGTYIYAYDGWLREFFSDAQAMFSPENGMRVMPLDNISFEETDSGSVRVITGDLSLLITPRSGGTMHKGRDD